MKQKNKELIVLSIVVVHSLIQNLEFTIISKNISTERTMR